MYEKSFDSHQTVTKTDKMRGKWEILSVSLPKKHRLYRNLQRFYGSDTNESLETRGISRCLFRLHNLFPQIYDIMWYIFDLGVFGDVVETPKTDTYFRPF